MPLNLSKNADKALRVAIAQISGSCGVETLILWGWYNSLQKPVEGRVTSWMQKVGFDNLQVEFHTVVGLWSIDKKACYKKLRTDYIRKELYEKKSILPSNNSELLVRRLERKTSSFKLIIQTIAIIMSSVEERLAALEQQVQRLNDEKEINQLMGRYDHNQKPTTPKFRNVEIANILFQTHNQPPSQEHAQNSLLLRPRRTRCMRRSGRSRRLPRQGSIRDSFQGTIRFCSAQGQLALCVFDYWHGWDFERWEDCEGNVAFAVSAGCDAQGWEGWAVACLVVWGLCWYVFFFFGRNSIQQGGVENY